VQNPNYFKEFAFSKTHAAIGVGVAAAFASTNLLAFMLAAAAYLITWVFFPTSHAFVRRINDRLKLAAELENEDKLGEFVQRRNNLIAKLGEESRNRYAALYNTCGEVSGNNPDNNLINGKLQELLWTYLNMLLMQQNIEVYLKETDKDTIVENLRDVEAEIAALTPEQARLKTSKESLKATLAQHKKSLEDGEENLQVLNSELTRLEHEIQLLRADAIANRNSDFLSAKINASVESLQESKAIMQSMSNVAELGLDMPTQAANLGFEPSPKIPPPMGKIEQKFDEILRTPRKRSRAFSLVELCVCIAIVAVIAAIAIPNIAGIIRSTGPRTTITAKVNKTWAQGSRLFVATEKGLLEAGTPAETTAAEEIFGTLLDGKYYRMEIVGEWKASLQKYPFILSAKEVDAQTLEEPEHRRNR